MQSEILRLTREYDHQSSMRLKLTAGENFVSDNVRRALTSSLSGRYATMLGPGAGWPYPHNSIPQQIIESTQALACDIFHGAAADVRPASGIVSTHIVLTSMLNPGDTFLSLADGAGAHFTTEEIAQKNGYRRLDIPYSEETGAFDVEETARLVRAEKASLIFVDPSMILSPFPLRALRKAVGPDLPIAYDASHVMGLIAGGQFQSPLKEGANIINGSTHKTLAGPYAGLIVTRDHPEQSHIAWRVMNGVRLFEVNYKPATIAAMGVAMEEYRDFGAEYVQAVIENGRRLGQVLAQHRGLHASEAPNGEYTNSHQVHVVLGPKEEAERISQVLEEANIDVNPTRIPFSAGQYGLRIGMAGVTRLGMEPETIMKIGHLIADVIEGKRAIIDIRNEVIQIAQTHEVVKYTHSTPDEDQLGFAERAP